MWWIPAPPHTHTQIPDAFCGCPPESEVKSGEILLNKQVAMKKLSDQLMVLFWFLVPHSGQYDIIRKVIFLMYWSREKWFCYLSGSSLQLHLTFAFFCRPSCLWSKAGFWERPHHNYWPSVPPVAGVCWLGERGAERAEPPSTLPGGRWRWGGIDDEGQRAIFSRHRWRLYSWDRW